MGGARANRRPASVGLGRPDKYLCEFVIAIEVEMGLRAPTSFSIPVLIEEDDLYV